MQLDSPPRQIAGLVATITRETVLGLGRCWWKLLGLAAVSFSAHSLLITLAGQVAINSGPAGLALVVLAITVRLVMIAVMVLVAASHIRIDGEPLISVDAWSLVRANDATSSSTQRRNQIDSIMIALAPLVLLYAGWELVNNDLHQFLVRLYDNTLATADMQNNSNINFREGWKSYIGWTVGIWAIKVVLEKVRDRLRWRPLDVLIVFAETGWIVLAWLVVTSVAGRFWAWLESREVAHWTREGTNALAEIVAPLGLNLPAVIGTGLGWLGQLGSLIIFQIAQPMIWLAVVGLVLGWGATESALVSGSKLGEAAERRWAGAPGQARKLLDVATRGMREKYVPVLAMLRLLWRSGPLPILTIAGLYAGGSLAGDWSEYALTSLLDPEGKLSGMAAETTQRGINFLLEPIRICFLAATFGAVLQLRVRQRAAVDQDQLLTAEADRLAGSRFQDDSDLAR